MGNSVKMNSKIKLWWLMPVRTSHPHWLAGEGSKGGNPPYIITLRIQSARGKSSAARINQ